MPTNAPNVTKIPTKRRTAAQRSHDEIYDLIREAKTDAQEARDQGTALADLIEKIDAKLDEKFDSLVGLIGYEGFDEHGAKVSTGVIGKIVRLEVEVGRRFKLYDGWVKYLAGFAGALTVLGGAVWAMFAEKLHHIFK